MASLNTQATDDAPPFREYNPLTIEHRNELQNCLFAANHAAYIYQDGVQVLKTLWDGTTAALYILPWSRGWSIFASRDRHASRAGFATCDDDLRIFQRKLYCPPHTTGPWRVPLATLTDATLDMLANVEAHKQMRLENFDRKHWYWPRAALCNYTKDVHTLQG